MAQDDKLPRYHLNFRSFRTKKRTLVFCNGKSRPDLLWECSRSARLLQGDLRGILAAALHRPAALFARWKPVLVLFIAYIGYSVSTFAAFVKENARQKFKKCSKLNARAAIANAARMWYA